MQTELNKVVAALHEFYAHEAFLLEKDLGERAQVHRHVDMAVGRDVAVAGEVLAAVGHASKTQTFIQAL